MTVKTAGALARGIAASTLAAALGLAWAGEVGQGGASPDADAAPAASVPVPESRQPAAAAAAPQPPAAVAAPPSVASDARPDAPSPAAAAPAAAPALPAAVSPTPAASSAAVGNDAGAPAPLAPAAAASSAEPSATAAAGETVSAPPARSASPASGAAPRTSLLPLAQPLWSELGEAQRRVLEPFASQWNALPASEKRAWADLALRFPRMKPEQRKRVEQRIVEWAALTPQQRLIARENYRLAQQRSSERLVAEWEAYQAMTPEQRSVLVSAGSTPSNTAARSAAGPTGLARVAYQPLPRRSQPAVAGGAGAATPATGSGAAGGAAPPSGR